MSQLHRNTINVIFPRWEYNRCEESDMHSTQAALRSTGSQFVIGCSREWCIPSKTWQTNQTIMIFKACMQAHSCKHKREDTSKKWVSQLYLATKLARRWCREFITRITVQKPAFQKTAQAYRRTHTHLASRCHLCHPWDWTYRNWWQQVSFACG